MLVIIIYTIYVIIIIALVILLSLLLYWELLEEHKYSFIPADLGPSQESCTK